MPTDDWLACVNGPLRGKLFLPGDDVPYRGIVRLAGHADGQYRRTGLMVLRWFPFKRERRVDGVGFYKAMTTTR